MVRRLGPGVDGAAWSRRQRFERRIGPRCGLVVVEPFQGPEQHLGLGVPVLAQGVELTEDLGVNLLEIWRLARLAGTES